MRTAQETYDYVANHLLTQGKKAKDEYGCQYRTSDGLKCAVGCLIPDEAYDRRIEGRGVHSFMDAKGPAALKVREAVPEIVEHCSLLQALQTVHDDIEPEDWPEVLTKVAHAFGLTPRAESFHD